MNAFLLLIDLGQQNSIWCTEKHSWSTHLWEWSRYQGIYIYFFHITLLLTYLSPHRNCTIDLHVYSTWAQLPPHSTMIVVVVDIMITMIGCCVPGKIQPCGWFNHLVHSYIIQNGKILTASWVNQDALQLWDLGTGRLETVIPMECDDQTGEYLYCAQFCDGHTVLAGGSGTNNVQAVNFKNYKVSCESN